MNSFRPGGVLRRSVRYAWGVCVVGDYRLYRLDESGRIVSAEWIEAADDEQALVKARDLCHGALHELWDHHRLVARIEPDAP